MYIAFAEIASPKIVFTINIGIWINRWLYGSLMSSCATQAISVSYSGPMSDFGLGMLPAKL